MTTVQNQQGIAKTSSLPAVYVASRASIPARAAMWRKFRAAGANICATWIDEDGEGQTECMTELWSRIEAEIRAAAHLVVYVESDDFPLKGAYIEVGMALGMGKQVFVVAPGVTLEAKSLRPLGSWAAHPRVRVLRSAEAAVFGNTSDAIDLTAVLETA